MSAIPVHLSDATLVADSAQRAQDRAEFAAKAFLARYRVATTRKGYALALRQWFQWCSEHFVDPLHAQRYHVELFAREVEETGRTIATVAAKLNALSGFYKFAVSDGLADHNPMLFVMRPRIERESTTIGLSRTEAADLASAAEASTPHDHAVTLILLYNGLRVSELCGLDVEHLGRHKGAPTARILRKGGKRQEISFAFPTWHGIERVLETHPSRTGAIFLTSEGNRMDRKAVGRIVKRMYLAAGIAKRGHPHALRHTCCTMARDSGEPDRDIIATFGWSDSRQLEYYDRSRDKLERNVTHGVAAYISRAQ